MQRCFVVFALIVAMQGAPAAAQGPAARDSLLDRLAGRWTMTGTVRGRPATYRLDAAWTLQRRFLELHMIDVHTPPAYEARVFVGPDTVPGRYLTHWLDNFGAAFSVPPATGRASGDTLTLDFAYPTGPFHDTFAYDRAADAWRIRLEVVDSAGGRKLFAEYQARRR
jgi:hypothetical protein